MTKKCECAAHSASECCCGAWDEPDYKALWKQMCERCDELDAKLADAAKQEPVVFKPPAKWRDDEIANGYRGIRWVAADGVYGRPTQEDVEQYLGYTHPQPKAEQNLSSHSDQYWLHEINNALAEGYTKGRASAKAEQEPKREPLTALQITKLFDGIPKDSADMFEFARAIEAAYGIKGE